MSQPTMYERGIGDSLPDRGRETGVAPGLAGAGHPCMHAQYMHAQYIHTLVRSRYLVCSRMLVLLRRVIDVNHN